MPEAGEQLKPAQPVRTWLPMVLWSAGILLVLGLVWLGAEAYRLRKIEKVLIEEVARPPAPTGMWSPDLRGAARRLGGPAEAFRGLRLYLALNRPYKREAILLLGACGRQAVPDLIRYSRDTEPQYRYVAISAMREMGPEAVGGLPAIIETTRNGTLPAERYMAVSALYYVGGTSTDVICAIVAALHDPDPGVIGVAAIELHRIGPAAATAVPELAKLLTHSSPGVRHDAAAALEGIGPQAASAVPALRAALNDPEPNVRTQAAAALKKINPEATEE